MIATASAPASAPVSLTVLVICRNFERYIAANLRSVFAADQPVELVFVDNGSRDSSVEVARGLLATAPSHITTKLLALQPERPLCRALNLGVAECRGEFIKLISADDALGPNFFTSFRHLVSTSAPTVGVWLAGSVFVDDEDRVLRQSYEEIPFGRPADGSPIALTERQVLHKRGRPPLTIVSAFYRRRVWEDIGGYDERFKYEDRPFLFNTLKRGWTVLVHPYNNTYYRRHGGAVSIDHAWMAAARIPILVDQALRADWSNKPIAAYQLARAMRIVAMSKLRAWRAHRR